MKIRQGFVSNSSSSSFLIYGIGFEDRDELLNSLTEEGKQKILNDERYKKYDNGIPIEELDEIEEYIPDEYYAGDYEGIYFGKSWDEVKDDQTGAEFKKEVFDTYKEYFDIKPEDLHTHEYCGYDG